MNYCSNCASPVEYTVPPNDDRPRFVCKNCGTVHYQNPRLVVGCIPVWEDKILLCLRDIEPRRGKWTLPAGYLENGETVMEGARRENLEETLRIYLADRPGGEFPFQIHPILEKMKLD